MKNETINDATSTCEKVGADAAEVEQTTGVSRITDDAEGARSTETVERRTWFSVPRNRNWAIVGAVALVAIIAIIFLWSRGDDRSATTSVETRATTDEHAGDEHAGEEHAGEEGAEVRLEPEALASAGLQYEGVTERAAVSLLRVTGTIESNPRGTQQVTPLVGGRVEQVNVAVGDRVGAGSVLAVIASPEIAELHGKLHEAETQFAVAERNLARVQRAENRVAVLQARARLDEAEATLRRTRRLVELGAGAGRDLITAETAHRTARAEYEFQSNISLNRELQEAQAAVDTARVDVAHQRDQLRALGAPVAAGERHAHDTNTALIPLRAPASGVVTERLINQGAGVQAGTTLFTISNLSTVFVIANVPESNIGQVREGTPAEIRTPTLGEGAITGRVSYIDPRLDETTRTARARIEVANPGERLRAGMFVEVGFQTGTGGASELMVLSAAVQRIGERTVVFIPKETEPGAFEIRDVELGGESEGYHRVLSGLREGERVVTHGSFTLKTQMLKGEMGDDDH